MLDLPAAIVLARNAARSGRIVAREVVERHIALAGRLDARTLELEGFGAVHVLRSTAEVDAARIEIEPVG